MNSDLSSIKNIARDFANKIWNDKNINVIDQLLHKEVIIHSVLGDFHGTKAIKDVVQH